MYIKGWHQKSHALSLRMAVIGRLMFVTHFEENMKAFKDAFSYFGGVLCKKNEVFQ